MRVIFNDNKLHKLDEPVAIALGSFDGIHIGHKMLIQELNLLRYSRGCKSLVYTFSNSPMDILSPEKSPPKILTIPERIVKFKDSSLDYLVFTKFENKLAAMEPEDFIKIMLGENYNIKYIVVGDDFRFGQSGKGDTKVLKELGLKYGFGVIVIPPLYLGKQIASSSIIRRFIQQGEVRRASMFLGESYSIAGKVIYGHGRGKKLGFPTANLEFDSKKVIPRYGIYLTKVQLGDEHHWALTNVGKNPTFNREGLFVESHILNFDEDLYGKKLRIYFLHRIRDEKKFKNADSLKLQIAEDVRRGKKFIYKAKGI